jgi:hypothetical protein
LIGTGEPITVTAGTDNCKYQEVLFAADLTGEWTFSADVEILEGSPSNIYVVFGNLNYQYTTSATFPIVNGHISGSVNFSNTFDRLMIYAGEFGKTAGNTIRFSKMKLEKEKYATLEKLSSEISLTKNSINASLKNYATKAELALTIENGVSKLSAYADKMLFEAGDFELNTDELHITPEGFVKFCKQHQNINGTFVDGEVKLGSSGITITKLNDNGTYSIEYVIPWSYIAETVLWWDKNHWTKNFSGQSQIT